MALLHPAHKSSIIAAMDIIGIKCLFMDRFLFLNFSFVIGCMKTLAFAAFWGSGFRPAGQFLSLPGEAPTLMARPKAKSP